MNKLIKVSVLLCFLFTSHFTIYGQKAPLDSICAQIDETMKLNMSIYDYKALNETVQKDLKSLQLILKEKNDIPENKPYLIAYEPGKKVSIMTSETVERVIWDNGSQSPFQSENKCIINANTYHIQIQFNALEELISDKLASQLKAVIDTTIKIQNRLSTTYNFSHTDGQLVHNKDLDIVGDKSDAIVLMGGVGVNLIKNQPVVDLSAEMGVRLSKKGIMKNQFYLSYNQLSDFGLNGIVNLNGFANIGYRYNLSNLKDKPNWHGIELGYLVKRSGNLFDKNTFRLGFNWSIVKNISVAPQLYLSSKSVYPGVRIGFGF